VELIVGQTASTPVVNVCSPSRGESKEADPNFCGLAAVMLRVGGPMRLKAFLYSTRKCM